MRKIFLCILMFRIKYFPFLKVAYAVISGANGSGWLMCAGRLAHVIFYRTDNL